MGLLFQQIFLTLTTPPGNMAYHVILAFYIAGALLACFNHWRASGFPQARRTVIGLGLLLLAQLALFASSGLAWQELIASNLLLPPLDRGVFLFSLVIAIWLWAFPESARLADAATTLLSLLILTLVGVALTWWSAQGAAMAFNATWLDASAGAVGLILIIMGSLTLVIRRPNGWGLGIGMLVVVGTGLLAHWLAPETGANFAGPVRLAQLVAYALLFTLPQRFPLPNLSTAPPSQPLIRERRRYSTDPKIWQSLLMLNLEPAPEKICQGLTSGISQLMLADLCLLVSMVDNQGQIVVACGYDLIREQAVAGFTLDERLYPVISSALRRSRAVRLPASSTSPDLNALGKALNLERAGHLLVVPLTAQGEMPALGLMLLSPYSNRGWTTEDQTFLSQSARALAHILQQTQQDTTTRRELEKAKETLKGAQAYENRLVSELDTARQALSQAQAKAESLAAIIAVQNNASDIPAALPQEAGQVKENVQVQPAFLLQPSRDDSDTAYLEAELRLALEDVARLEQSLAETDQKLLLMERQTEAGLPIQQVEVLTSLAQELRQPLASVAGYTDVLLGESVGILGASQRKILERVKAAVERTTGLVEDLSQVVSGRTDDSVLSPETINLGEVIDQAIAVTVPRLREKNITLRVDLPDHLPSLHADRDAIQQIILHLMENAWAATPIEGEISLHARVENAQDDAAYILVQVSDNGEGIPPQDLPRVFSRLYRSDNPIIQGVGHNGVGLSIARSLVEAHQGRIWIDSEPGRGSTFSVLLPLSPASPAAGAAKGQG